MRFPPAKLVIAVPTWAELAVPRGRWWGDHGRRRGVDLGDAAL